ncbi:MAG: catalase [Clostridia bacterium]|nr:catalase [Clostridia bacterium]
MHPFSHLRTITRHHNEVFRLCRRAGIGWRGFWHDFSKLSPTEFFAGARFYTDGTHSPTVEERRTNGCSRAWMHHMGRNRHHFEYWVDYRPGEGLQPVEMPPVFFCEMICDRIAACKIYRGKEYVDADSLAYFNRQKHTYYIHPSTAAHMEYVFTLLADRGEDALFEYLRVFAKTGIKGN